MKITRNETQWQTLIQNQQTSGLTISNYCQQHQLPTSSFYAFKKKLGLTSNSFVRAKVIQKIEFLEEQPSITLTVGKASVSLPATTPATYLAQILRELN
jgi:SOS-response transcriptional repressor LexA